METLGDVATMLASSSADPQQVRTAAAAVRVLLKAARSVASCRVLLLRVGMFDACDEAQARRLHLVRAQLPLVRLPARLPQPPPATTPMPKTSFTHTAGGAACSSEAGAGGAAWCGTARRRAPRAQGQLRGGAGRHRLWCGHQRALDGTGGGHAVSGSAGRQRVQGAEAGACLSWAHQHGHRTRRRCAAHAASPPHLPLLRPPAQLRRPARPALPRV